MPYNNRQPVTLDYNDTLDFGMYSNKTCEYVLSENPIYLKWVIENVEWVTFTDELYDEINDIKVYPDDTEEWRHRQGT